MEPHHRGQGRLLCRDLKVRDGRRHHRACQPHLQLPLRHLPQLRRRVSSLPNPNVISEISLAAGRRLVRRPPHGQLCQQDGRRSEQASGEES